jgi:predicted peroxiredoxin
VAEEKLVVLVTHGPEAPELATIPFAMAGAAVASDVDVVVGLQGEGCLLAKKGVAAGIAAPELAPLGDLIETIQELGGRLLACAPSVKSRGIADDELLDGVEVVAAGRLVAEVTSATNSLVY